MWLSNETSVAELRAMGRLQSIVKSKLVNRAVQCGTNCLVGFVLPSHKSLRARLFVEGIRTSFMAESIPVIKTFFYRMLYLGKCSSCPA